MKLANDEIPVSEKVVMCLQERIAELERRLYVAQVENRALRVMAGVVEVES